MSNTKTIAKNSLFLYFRMFLTMGVGLYTSRVVLNTLGIEDFGVYSIVGGVVASFGFLSSTISSANSRFISYAIGKNDQLYLRKIFSLANTNNFIIAFVIFLICEISGTWWINNKVVVPEGKMHLAHIIFQISLLSSMISLISSSFVALIISYERMGVFAVTQLVQVILKLVVVFCLPYISFNNALSYAFLLFLINIIFFVFYVLYCKKHFICTTFKLNFSKDLKEIFSFSSWDLYGNFSVTARTEGISILQNLFFGVGINAAIGIANQVQGAVSSFASSILFASKPQVIKSYAQDNYEYMNDLIIKSAKYSTLFLCFVIVPLIVELDYIVALWLGVVPDYVLGLIKWFLLFVVGANISSCIMMGIHATGKIMMSSFINGTLYLLVVPISYFLFRKFHNPEIPYILNFCFVLIGANLNMIYFKKYVPSFSILKIYQKAILPVFLVSFLNFLLLIYIKDFLNADFMALVITIVISSTFIIIFSWLLLIEKEIKQFIIRKIWR